MSMRTNAWVVAVLALGGCTGNLVSLDTDGDSDSATDGTGGTWGTETSPPADSGSDDGPRPQCEDSWDCGDCGWCNAGVCEEDVGCCSALPEDPWVWHCSPPWDCFDDEECGEGMVCNDGYCEPGPERVILEPPACRGDLALEVQQLSVGVPIVQLAVIEGQGLQGIDADLGLVQIDLAAGVSTPQGGLLGEEAVDFLRIDGGMGIVITQGPDAGGALMHQLTRTTGGDGAWTLDSGPLTAGSVHAGAWAGVGTAEVLTAIEARLDRWSVDPVARFGALEVGAVGTLAVVEPLADDATALAVTVDDGRVYMLDGNEGTIVAASEPLIGESVGLVGSGPQILALSYVPARLFGAPQDMAAIHVLRPKGDSLVAAAPFGAPGIPQALVMAEIDGNGIDDVLVANADGRLDIYLMQADGPLCRTYLPMAAILELEVGDVNGDGRADVLISDAGPVVTAIHGAAAG